MKTLRDTALELWVRELGKPYLWGGDDPMAGFDCSGLAVEHLQSVGILPSGDWTARALAEHFGNKKIDNPVPGSLIFWNRGSRIGHVEIVWRVIGDRVLTIGASGGGSRTTSEADAINQNAYIKVRPARRGWTLNVDPFQETV